MPGSPVKALRGGSPSRKGEGLPKSRPTPQESPTQATMPPVVSSIAWRAEEGQEHD